MLEGELSGGGAQRAGLVTAALRLVSVSVAFGLAAGGVSVAAGLGDHSLGVFGTGLAVLADVTGSAVVMWRFRAERGQPVRSAVVEARAAAVVAVALAVVGVVLAAESAAALAAGSHPGSSAVADWSAGVTFAVLAPLACAKRGLGRRLASPALRGDGSLSALGAATSLLALAGLLLYRTLGWWWADRAVALVVAAVAAIAAWHTAPGRSPPRASR